MPKDATFCFDAKQETWTECRISDWQTKEAASLPIIVVCDLHDERTGEHGKRAWCETHRAYEEIADFINEGIVTADNCCLRGIAVFTKKRINAMGYGFDPDEVIEIILRWQVRHDLENGHVILAKDSAHINFRWQRSQASERFVLAPYIRSFSHVEATLSPEGPHPPRYLCSMPAVVVSSALKMLEENVLATYGIIPAIDFPDEAKNTPRSPWESEADFSPWLLAFLHRPLDMRIWFYRDLFTQEDFDTHFPKTQADNFPELCRALGLPPTGILRRAYETGRTALLLQGCLSALGITQETLQEKFTGCPHFLGTTGRETYGKPLLLPPVLPAKPDEAPSETWEHLRFYCSWRRENESEDALAAELLRMNNSWKAWKSTALALFHQLFSYISSAIKEDILQNGLTVKARDEMAMTAQEQAMRKPDFDYDKKTRALECKIGGYNFRLIHSAQIFRKICFHGLMNFTQHLEDLNQSDSALIALERDGAYLGMAIVQDGVVQDFHTAFDMWNAIGCASIYLAYARWICHAGLSEKYPRVRNEIRGKSQELPVEPIDRDEIWETMSLRELLAVPETSIRSGYYTYLFRRLMETGILRPAPPGANDDEYAYLSEHYPVGNRIYDGARAETPEAQHVMGLLYSKECHQFAWCDLRLSAKWHERARRNGWEKIAPSGSAAQLEMFFPNPESSGYSRDAGGWLAL